MILKLDSKRIQLARQAEQTVHVRFRMYKAKKRWLIAGAALLFIPAFFQPGHEVKADTSLPQTQVTATSQAAEPATSQSAVTSDQATTSSNAVNATNSGEAVKASSAASAASSQTSSSSAAQTLTSQAAAPEQTTDASQVASATSAQVVSGSGAAQSAAAADQAATQAATASETAASSAANSQASSAQQSASSQAQPVATAAAQPTVTANTTTTDATVDGLTYSFDETTKTATVTGHDSGATLTDINIGPTVSYNGQAYTVTAIQDVAFFNLSNLTSLHVASTVTTIGASAFAYSKFTGGITVDNAAVIGKEAFAGVNASAITLNGAGNIGESSFAYATITGVVSVAGPATIGQNAFYGLKAESLTLDDEVANIGEAAFAYETINDTINVAGSATIGKNAFYGTKATSLTLGGKATTLAETAFGYARITNVTVDAATISNQAFFHLFTDNLMFGPDVQTITGGAFQFIQNMKDLPNINGQDNPGNQIPTLTIPANISVIDGSAFYGSKLGTVAIADNSRLTTLGFQAFAFSSAAAINLPDSLEQIGDQAFYGGHLVQVAFGPNLQSIGDLAFTEFGPLQNVDFSRATALESIGDSAFAYNTINNAIVLPPNLKTIKNAAFVGNKIPALTLNDGLQTIGDSAFGYNKIQNGLAMPDSVTAIGKYAFVYNSISNLTLGTGLQTIGQEAFEANIILNALNIPASVTAIGAKAFNANLIPEVAIAGTPTIDQEAFSNNRITVLHAATAVPTTPDALNQNADAYTDSAHVSLRDLFSVAISGVSQDQIVVSNIQGTGVVFNTATKSFTMPAGTEQFSFNWSLKAADGTTYTGLYKVHLNDPVIHAHDINLFTGQDWKPELNFGGAVKKDGTEVPLSDLTWTVTDQNGNVIASKDKDGIVTGSVPNDQATWYTVTYAYGAESGSAKIFYNQRLAASYSLTGTQTATATGQPITVDLTAFSLSLGDGFNAGALQLSDLNFFDASGNQIAADALAKTGVYRVELSKAAWARIAELTNDAGESAANYNFTGTSTAQLIIGLTATGQLNNSGFTYDGMTLASQAPKLVLNVTLSDGSQQAIDLTSTDISLVEADSPDVGTYRYLLNGSGLTRIQAILGDEVTIDQTDINTHPGVITITPATATATVNGTQFVYDGKTIASQASGLQLTLTAGSGTTVVDLSSTDIVVGSDSVNVGDYQYQLSQSGVAKVEQALNANYQLPSDLLGSLTGTITIAPAQGTAELRDDSFIYDGKTKASQAQGLTGDVTIGNVTVPVILTSADIAVGNDGVNVGNYQYSLTNTGIAKLQQAVGSNYQLNADDLAKLTGTITITPAEGAVNLSDTSFVYDGKTKASQAQGLTANVTVGNETVPVTVTTADIAVANDGMNVGNYQYSLTNTGIVKLQQAVGNNYQLNASELAKLAGTITITPAEGAVNLSDTSFVYDGKTRASQAQGLTANVTVGSATVPVILAPADFVVGNDGVNVGSYRYTLTATGIAKLQQAVGSNYQLTVSELAKLTGNINITPATTTADLNDGSFMYDGQTKASQAQGLTAVVKLGDDTTSIKLDASDIVVADDGVNVGSYHYRLSTDAITKLQQVAGPNYQLKADDLAAFMGIVTITPS
ncbi:leucine-rich repeat protein [Lacticaseibacillus paracasei]|uniref:leucine-rich repeat protein n=1 Tax=Lacticaseibacillus paracasei TaxID=1597 RepID=UPI002889C82F|nr:leucine-rich repeat protein [Lacticaseibacillus paracasei]